MKRILITFFAMLFVFVNIEAQTNFTINDLLKVRRVGDPQVSPDGKTVLFAIGDVNKEKNRTFTQIYAVPTNGGETRQVTSGEKSNSSPRWSPNGEKIAYTTGGQIWTMNADGSAGKQITTISSGASSPVWSPDGKKIAFVSDVYPDCADDACNQKRDETAESSKVQAHVTDRLLYRHWVEWRDKKRTHVFIVSSDGGMASDMTVGDYDSPPYAASTNIDFAFSPDSNQLAYLRNPDKVEATSTNSDIYTRYVGTENGGSSSPNITASNKGYDATPVYTADGKYLLYRSQATATFEADRWRIMRYDRKTKATKELTVGFDQQVEEFVVSPDNKMIYFVAGERGRGAIFSISIDGGKVTRLLNSGFASDLRVADANTLVFAHNSTTKPTEIMKLTLTGASLSQLTNANTEAIKKFGMKDVEDVEWTGAENAKVHGFVIKPANFDPAKKYPLMVLIHGGPQGAWHDNFGYRWNPQIFANAGYVVFMPNPRGSTTYGQKFVDEISGDWGGKAYVDIMNGVADVLKKNAFIDKSRIGGAGASYGGYMVDWILGHNNDPRFKFAALLSHAGVYNLESMAGATEELWFARWEFKGMPWENATLYNKWSPNKFVNNFSTPTLVTCGELDYRVPVDQSLQLFTALQLKNVESKLIVYPDEGHWILKPQNSEFWYNNVLDWFGKHLKP